jgi:hypothetical protein
MELYIIIVVFVCTTFIYFLAHCVYVCFCKQRAESVLTDQNTSDHDRGRGDLHSYIAPPYHQFSFTNYTALPTYDEVLKQNYSVKYIQPVPIRVININGIGDGNI